MKLSTLQIKADKAASDYIRMKYADHAGCITCITCGKYLYWKEAHCAHYIERKHMETRWLEENLHPACSGCNAFNKEFHKRKYTLFIIDTYGRDKVEELEILGKKVVSPTRKRQLAEEALAYYTQAAKELA